MSEREPQPEQQPRRVLRLEAGGEVYELTSDDTLAFLHKHDQQYDHIFINHETLDDEDSDDVWRGWYYFRHEIPNFNEVIAYMRTNGFNIVDKDDVASVDRQAFDNNIGTEAMVTLPEPLRPHPLTSRQERFVNHFRYLLDHHYLTPRDFGDQDGELYI